ncbi:putative histone acetyltransferase chromatin regulator PHD family [Medicago truncatula]|uniref:histone acetyltransferase n=1 Tax=Medicago truncatula TaxID=3880 RepID=A0A396HHL1_MEDTR|nr:putative histone acetyltransferase chromatin regulator PHD family [Medicago truncatula]
MQIPTDFQPHVSYIQRKRAFDELSNQYLIKQRGFSTNWRDRLPVIYSRNWMRNEISKLIQFAVNPINNEKIATVLEWKLFVSADSKEAYMNVETLNQRVAAELDDDAISFADAYYGVQPSVAHELPRLPESIPTIADTDMLYNVTISGDGNYVPQQHAHNFEIDMTMGKPLQPKDFSDFFSECQSQKLDIKVNLAHDISNKRRKMESGCDVSIQHKDVIIIDDDDEEDIQDRTVFSQEGGDDLERHGMTDKTNHNPMEIDIGANDNMHAFISQVPITIDVEEKEDRNGFNQEKIDADQVNELIIKKIDADQVNDAVISKVPIPIDVEQKEDKIGFNQEGTDADQVNDDVSLIDMFTHDQITEHITSLKKQSVQSTTEVDNDTCNLCGMNELPFSPVQIFCSSCGKCINRNVNYFGKKGEEFDPVCCFCSDCYKMSKGGHITFNGTSVSKTLLEKKTNDEVINEPWVECSKCNKWQHQICALYNKDLDCNSVYTCPLCLLKEIENGKQIPLKEIWTDFGAKDLPKTVLSDHLEKRLFERLMQEREERQKIEGNENFDEVKVTESLTVREVISVDKQLTVKKQFQDITPEENYPAEFSYRSRVILLFQKIEGADVCIFAMYVQEYGSECGNPNQRCVYISYLDSVNHFTPRRQTTSGEALRTLVYHEILIGYLDFCKKRGFTTCYIHACAPKIKGDDYILNCHPKTQKTPKDDKLRNWYISMLTKATKENVVVGLTNMYDHFFVSTETRYSKVTTARMPYFDGDCWSGAAMDQAVIIEKECGSDYGNALKKVLKSRSLKAMGYVNPPKAKAKDILVMQKVLVDDIPFNTKENDIILENALFENRSNFLSFCQKNHFQFDTLRHAKYSSMMILYHLKSNVLSTV